MGVVKAPVCNHGQFCLHFLATHCGHHLNPIEGFWRVMKDAIGAGRCVRDLPTLYQHTRQVGFDHGAGHPLLFLDDAKVPNCRKNNGFMDLGNYSEWPKVAGAVIKAAKCSWRIKNGLSMSFTGSSFRLELSWRCFGPKGRVLLALDNDEAGRKGSEDACNRLRSQVFVREMAL